MVEQYPQSLKHFGAAVILGSKREGTGIQAVYWYAKARADHKFRTLFQKFLQLGTHCGRSLRFYFGIYNLLNFGLHIAVQTFFPSTFQQVVQGDPRFVFIYSPR